MPQTIARLVNSCSGTMAFDTGVGAGGYTDLSGLTEAAISILQDRGVKQSMSTPGAATPEAASIQPATGKLGIMMVGMGAVCTTLIAGVEAVRQGLAKPIGSLTQMGTIRLGKRTDGTTPLIKDFLPIAQLEDLVFTGWDIFGGNLYQARRQQQCWTTRRWRRDDRIWSRLSRCLRRSTKIM